jgi:hypothetical protein
MKWQDVPGWCDFEDVYTEAVECVPSGGHLVELGSAFGKLAALMCFLIESSKKDLRFDAVDSWQKIEDWMVRRPPGDFRHEILKKTNGDKYEAFLHFMKETNSLPRVNPIRASFLDALGRYQDRSLDFVFLDGDHTYEGTKKYLRAIVPKIKSGGVVAGHDYESQWPGLVLAVDEIFPDRRLIGRRCFWQQI